MYELSQCFFTKFNHIFSEDSEYYHRAIEYYSSNTDFTHFIMQRINQIIEIMGEGKFTAQNEYYRIDAVGYSKGKLDSTNLLYPHLWDLEIAIEHENSSKDWLDEIIKLAHICCPLRVVIGYVPVEQRDLGDAERLNYAASALKQLKCRDNLKNGEFMIILGNSNTKCQIKNFFNYKAYILNKQTLDFEPLNDYHI